LKDTCADKFKDMQYKVGSVCGKHKKAVHIFTIFTESFFNPKSEHSSHTENTKKTTPKKAFVVWLILNYYNDQSTIAIAMCSF